MRKPSMYLSAAHLFRSSAIGLKSKAGLTSHCRKLGSFRPTQIHWFAQELNFSRVSVGTTEKTIEFVYPAEDQGNCDATPVVGETFLFMRGGEPPYSGNMCNTFWIYNGSNVLNRLELDYGLKLDVPGYKTEK